LPTVTEQGLLDPPGVDPPGPAAGARPVPRLAEGTELLGEYQGSGYREPKYLVGRADGQVIALPHLLYQVTAAVDGTRTVDEVAAHVGARLGRRITPDQVSTLLADKLRPAGITAADGPGPDDTPVALPRPDPLLLLRFRLPVIPPRVVWRIAGLFQPFYWPPVLVTVLGAFVALDVTLVLNGVGGEVVASGIALAREPTLSLLVVGAVLACGVFHEFGHVAACRYGGARPGVMGVGIYLVWPAYYSTVTDSYRLSRRGRLRTDLGGVYFNAACIAVLTAAYLGTGAPWLLLAVVTMHVQTVWQFLPSIRLDGYYILSDLIGLPDLFMFLGPVLKSVVPGRSTDPRVAELRPGVRRTIVVWVLLVIPFLLFFLVSFLVLAPQVLPEVWHSLRGFLALEAEAIRSGDAPLAALVVVQILFLLLPVLGVALLLTMIGGRIGRAMLGRRAGAATRPAAGVGRPRPVRYLLAVAVPMTLLTLLAVAGVDQRTASAGEAAIAASTALASDDPLAPVSWPDVPAVHQIAAVDTLLGGAGRQTVIDSARTVLLVVNLLGSLLLWPVARRIGLPAPAAATAVALAGLPAPLVLLHGSVDAGGLAAGWLIAAAGLAGRGRWANRAALGAALTAVLTAPLAAVGLLVLGAHGMLTGQFGRRLPRRTARVLAAAAAASTVLAAVRSTGTGPWVVAGGGTVATAPLLAALAVGGAVLVGTWRRAPGMRPVVTATAALLLSAAVPGPHATTALLLAAPALAVLAAVLLEKAVVVSRPRRARLVLAAVVGLGVATAWPLVLAASAPDPDRGALGRWLGTQLDPATVLQADPLTAAQLLEDGFPADRVLPVGAVVPPGRPRVVVSAPGDAGPQGLPSGPARLLLAVPAGPGGGRIEVHRPDGG
jgi:putative peptide zinc metalloprotease protein